MPDQVCDRGSVLTRPAAHLLMIQLQFAAQAVECLRGFNCVQILTLDVFDQRDLQQPFVWDLLNHGWHLGHSGDFGGAPAAFTGHQLIPFRLPPDDKRLDNSIGANGLR